MTRPTLIATAALLVLTACGDTKPPTTTPTLDTVASPTAGAPTSTAAASAATGGGTATTSKPSSTTGGGSNTSGPTIEYFRIKTKPSCPSSGPGFNNPGYPIVLEWKVTGGPTEVTISIDGPGLYGTYPAVSTQEFPFACSGTSGSTQKHKYLLKTVGGTVRQAELTGEARVN